LDDEPQLKIEASIPRMPRVGIAGFHPILFCVALTYIDDIEDDNIAHLEPQEVISTQAIRSYFEKVEPWSTLLFL
jgi:hypothetical protein